MNQFCKGQLVIVKAYAHFEYILGNSDLPNCFGELVHRPLRKHKTVKVLFHRECVPFEAMIIGKTKRATGYYKDIGYIDDSPSLSIDKWHDVWLAVPLGNGIDYLKPFTVLEDDIEIQTRRHARASYLMRRKWLDMVERKI